MGKVVYAEEHLLNYLRKFANLDSSAIGLIIGQATKASDYVILLARTPEERDKANESCDYVQPLSFNTLKDIDEGVIVDHAKHVTKMLPGGLNVLGVFVCSPTAIFNDTSLEPALKRILLCMKKIVISETFPDLHSETQKLLLHFNSVDQKFICKALDINNSLTSAFKPVEWKFTNLTKWCQLSTKFDMNWPSIGGRTSLQLKTQLKKFLSEINKLLDPAIIAIGNKVHNQDQILESLTKISVDKKYNNEAAHLEASIFTPLQDSSTDDDIFIFDCDVELHLMGVLRSQVFLTQKSSVEEVITAIKQDIVRSLSARMELHWDSLIEEEYGSPEEKQTIHEPPRRVSVLLPNSSICLNDYIFPGEGPNEVIGTFKELLDIEITEENVNDEYENHGDPLDLCGKSAITASSTSSDDLLTSTLPTGFLIIAISFAVILIGIAIAIQIQQNESVKKIQ